MSGVEVPRDYSLDTGAFRVGKEGATKLADACAASLDLIDRDKKLNAAIADFQRALGIEGASAFPFNVRSKLDAMLNLASAQAAALARFTGGAA